jgi:hypothetical protein
MAKGTLGAGAGALDRANLAGHRASAADRHGQPPAKPKLANSEAQLGKPSMGTGVSPRGGARGGLTWLPAGWTTSMAGTGHRRGRAVWAEHARERARLCEIGRGSKCGRGRYSKSSWGAWAGDVARDLSVRAHVLVHGGRGEGGVDRAVPRHSEREQVRAGGVMVRRTDEAGPLGRGGKAAHG